MVEFSHLRDECQLSKVEEYKCQTLDGMMIVVKDFVEGSLFILFSMAFVLKNFRFHATNTNLQSFFVAKGRFKPK